MSVACQELPRLKTISDLAGGQDQRAIARADTRHETRARQIHMPGTEDDFTRLQKTSKDFLKFLKSYYELFLRSWSSRCL